MPSKADKLIIDSIVTVTHYEAYFRGRCEEVISEKAIAENWSAEKISKAKSQIKYADFKFDVHNVFGRYTHEEIKELLAKYKKDKTCRNNNVLLDSRMVEGNLNLYADRLGNE